MYLKKCKYFICAQTHTHTHMISIFYNKLPEGSSFNNFILLFPRYILMNKLRARRGKVLMVIVDKLIHSLAAKCAVVFYVACQSVRTRRGCRKIQLANGLCSLPATLSRPSSLSLSLSPNASEHFPKPHRDMRTEPFDARCCRGYWIKVSQFAEEIISQAARGTGLAASLALSRPSLRNVLSQEPPLEKKLIRIG